MHLPCTDRMLVHLAVAGSESYQATQFWLTYIQQLSGVTSC